MQSRTLSTFLAFALAAGTAVAQSSNPAPAQPNPPQLDSAGQPVGISGQAAPDNSAPPPQAAGLSGPQRQARFLARQLGLNPNQQAQISGIIADRDQQFETLRTNTTMAPRDRRAQMQALMEDSRGRIEAVMTDEQKQHYEQMIADRLARRQQQQQGTQPQAQPQQQQQPQAQPQAPPQQQPQ